MGTSVEIAGSREIFDTRIGDEVLKEMEMAPPENKIRKMIDNLELSADAKAKLNELGKTVITIGEKVISFGRWLLGQALRLISKFPNTAAGIILGMLLGHLGASIPFVGFIVGPVLLVLLPALGLSVGFWADMNGEVMDSVRRVGERLCNVV